MPAAAPIKVLIVDDSAVIRSVISRTLTACPDISVVGTAANGMLGVNSVRSLAPDIVILDIEMPVMDGITALPMILKENPRVKVLICSTLSARGADVSLRALSLGAADYILKPGAGAIGGAEAFQDELIRAIRAIAGHRNDNAAQKPGRPALRPPVTAPFPPRILAIGSSTGGPKALMEMLSGLKGLPVPIVITQHMPKTFTSMLAAHIEEKTGIPSFEGAEDMAVEPGKAYVAPGGMHMTLVKNGLSAKIHLTEDPPENFCRPSVNPMLRSLIPIYEGRVLAVILTGMGADGAKAAADIVKAGGRVIAQDEATSVVWGMPGAVAQAGLCSAVLPLGKISEAVKNTMKGAPL